jgi:hypothetical protein
MVKQLLPILVKDVVPPIAVYYVLHLLGANDWVALLGGVVVSGVLMVLEAVRARRLDVFSGFMMAMFGAGLAASFVTGDPRFVVMKSSLVTGVIGMAFLVSCLVGKPLTYLAHRKSIGGDPEAVAALETAYRTVPRTRRVMRAVSVVWGAGLLAEAVLRVVLAYQLPVSTMVGLSTVLLIGTIGLLLVITAQVARSYKRSTVQA